MLKKFALPFLLFMFALPAIAHATPKIGEAAPDFSVEDINGEAVNLADLKGKYVVLEWNNNKCPFVKKHYDTGNMQKLQKEVTGDDVVWITVVSSAPGKQGFVTAEEAKEIVKTRDAAPTHVVLDPEGTLGKAYDAKTTPHMFVINKDGNLAYAGAIDDNDSMRRSTVETASNYVRLALASLKKGEQPETQQTQPYGCSVKY